MDEQQAGRDERRKLRRERFRRRLRRSGHTQGRLPDFLIIGTQKGGTTTLYRLLAGHPLIEQPAMKEVHFFDAAFERGVEWYRSHFPPPSKVEGGETLSGESTPYYLYDPLVPERAARVVPAARLIVLLRNPVDRAYSHYHHELRLGAELLPFEAAVEAENGRLHANATEEEREFARRHFSYLSRGLYAEQLARWHKHFDSRQVLVLKSEDLFDAPLAVLFDVLRFLGLPDWEPPGPRVQNPGGYGTTMREETRRSLKEYFQPHNEKLYTILGKTLDW